MRKKNDSAILPDSLAAVDLGSNSFHMIVARVTQGELQVVDRMREMVRIAAGLNKKYYLSAEVQERAIACLQRYAQRLGVMPPGSVRAVGTNTLRRARNAPAFLALAQQALGYPIEIISGQEEARLIYIGVAHSLADDAHRRLVIDIGGGSTEFIIGEHFEPLHMESLEIGCVSGTLNFFPKGVISCAHWESAYIAASQELQAIAGQFRQRGWEVCIGASGTVKAIFDIVNAQQWGDSITLVGLRKLRARLLSAGHIRRLNLPELSSERAAVLPGGLAILLAIFDSLGIERMRVSDGALREGLLYDLLGRVRQEDIRERTVTALCARYHVDMEQAARVEQTAQVCFEQLSSTWPLKDYEPMLGWAARLHEIGLAVSHSQYRKHGAYLVGNSDMPGFSRQDQQLLTALILGQRSKLLLDLFAPLPDKLAKAAIPLCILLRLAVLLHRSRSDSPLPRFSCSAEDKTIQLKFPKKWLNDHPLTQADLVQEARHLKAAGIGLKIM